MKKLLVLVSFMILSFNGIAQNKLRGSLGTYAYNNIGNRYTNLNWEVSYKFEKRNDGIYLKYYDPKVTVAQNALYATAEKNYSKSELGLSVWPEIDSPASLNVSVDCRLPNGKIELSGFACSTSDPYDLYEDWICATTLNGKEVDLSAFTLSVTKGHYIPQRIQELDDIIKTKKSQNAGNIPSRTTQNSSSNNPLGTSSTAQNISQTPSLESQYAKLGIPASTPTYTKSELKNQLVTEAATTVMVGLANELNASMESREARLEAEYQAKIAAEYDEKRKKQKTKFITEFIPLLRQAENGDENARMTLYFASEALGCYEFVPKREQWFREAVANDNKDAICGKKNGTYFQDIQNLEATAIPLGNVDAMIKVAMWYSQKISYQGLSGGGDEQKALDYFKRAAAAGSPNAMYFLGMIYTYGQITDNKYEKPIFIKFTVAKDERLALDWFIKADQPDFKESIYSRSITSTEPFIAKSSYYVPYTRYQIYRLYKKGKVVKDKAKAEEMKGENLQNRNYTKDFVEYYKVNEKFSDIARYK